MKLREKITLFVLTTSILATGLTYALLESSTEKALKESSFSNLTAIRSIKTTQIEEYFSRLSAEVSSIALNPHTVKAAVDLTKSFSKLNFLDKESLIERQAKENDQHMDPAPQILKQILGNLADKHAVDSPTLEAYLKAYDSYHEYLAKIKRKFGFYDIMIANARSGDIVYSVEKESEFATSITEGSSRANAIQLDDPIHAAFVAIVSSRDKEFVKLIDFDFFRPSNNIPAAFIAAPVYNGKRKVAVVIVQISIQQLDDMMTGNGNWNSQGLGSTGETYIVGADTTMRSTSRSFIDNPKKYLKSLKELNYSPENITRIEKHNTTILAQEVDTIATKEAFQNISDTKIIENYRGVNVVSSYAPLNIPGVDWAIISEVDADEVFAPIYQLKKQTLIEVSFLVIFVILFSVVFAKRITKSLAILLDGIKKLGDGNFSQKLRIQGNDEISELADYFNHTAQELSEMSQSVNYHSNQSATLQEKIHKVVEESRIDRLTGAYNRSKLAHELSESLNSLSMNSSQQVSLIMFDLDNFKQVNDTHGHDKGDEILITLSNLVMENCKESYTFCRWGGDEFMILLPGESNIKASLFSDHIRKKILNNALLSKHKITGSFGILELNAQHTVDSAFKVVDSVLYRAKKAGKNCVRTYTESLLKTA
jgi:diguanylate cyclase (GGDEF)-like protein